MTDTASRTREGKSGSDTSPADGTALELAVRTCQLVKVFGRHRAVDGIDLAVPRGSVYGFLGPNGSGKTTTIRMLLGLIFPSDGTIDVLGHDVPKQVATALPRVGALVEGPAFHLHLSGRANLRRLDSADASASPRTSRVRIDSALERVGLTAAATKRVRAYSLGMKQRLGIAAALLQPHDLLVLDEPTNGLDPQGTREVRHLVSTLADDGTTVLVSSHLLSEVEQMCTHVGVMSRGRLVAQSSLSDLQATGEPRVDVRTPDPDECAAELTRLGLADVLKTGDVTGTLGDHQPEDVVRALVAAGVRVRGFQVTHPSLEDLFVDLTGEGFDVS